MITEIVKEVDSFHTIISKKYISSIYLESFEKSMKFALMKFAVMTFEVMKFAVMTFEVMKFA